MSEQYKHNSLASAPAQSYGVLTAPGAAAVALQNNGGLPARPTWATTGAMRIWIDIFPQAMDRFRSTPGLKNGPRPGYNIRDKDDWDSIYDMLLAARAEYQNKGGVVGLLRKVRRSAADNVGPAVEIAHAASKIAPNDPYATPVLGAVEVVLDAVENAARVRNQVLEGFDGLVHIFSDVELFLGTFEQDHYVWNASMDLTLTTLEAVERAIVFFLSSDCLQAEQSRLTPPPPLIKEWSISQEALRRILDIPELDLTDSTFIVNKKAQLPPRQMAEAEKVMNTSLFREWMVSPLSARVLVQWDVPTPPRTVAGVSPLSAFCATMAKALQARGPRFLPLLWFCGRHVDAADPDSTYIGARYMLPSLVDQLLRQYEFDLRPLHHDVDLTALQAGSSEGLTKLLEWLVRRLSRSTTVVFIIDGVVLFEREEFQALPELSSLLRLAADPSVPAAVKVLFASTPGTDVVRAAFEKDGLILDVGTLPRIADAPNEERMNREMGGSDYAPMY
ncbi:hypothetical protein DIS24_g2497 [Lasiodiplodia hormozganensis]|uniref:Uncharacterized protein n=1 Tax=Lasiodiplodia hormozganensis TaxID=869390 RepID=A0AA40D5U9_9PEZI|nr:hypothetical protein DIS24_g2497 [Lasiodiplodia hormozganensis]